MNLLSFDSGAKRMGYAALQTADDSDVTSTPIKLGYGHLGLSKEDKTYQQLRLDLIRLWIEETPRLIQTFSPDEVVCEIIPPVGGKAFKSNGIQAQLATTALTALQTVVLQHGIKLFQVAAVSVKSKIGGTRSATKVQVREGVIKLMPPLEVHRKEWTTQFDVPDAFAVGLTHLGFSNK